jgi:processive 1,2-diacylglycerol beta-glucosyltransferase
MSAHQTTIPIILLYCSVGSGHRVAAEAIAENLAECVPARVLVRDAFDFRRTAVDGATLARSFTGLTGPVYDLGWNSKLSGTIARDWYSLTSTATYAPLDRWLVRENPAAVVCTHAIAANVAQSIRRHHDLDFPLICVPTDFGLHTVWPFDETDLFCVASETLVEVLAQRGVPEDKVAVTGIPLRKEFIPLPEKTRGKRRLRVLALLGAGSPEPYRQVREIVAAALPELAAMDALDLTLICGRDEDYVRALQRYASDSIDVRGYVDDIATTLAQSDVVVCKAGGLICAECLCAGTPPLLTGRTYGQERANKEVLTRTGVALSARGADEVVQAIRALIEDPYRLEGLRARGARLCHKDAAQQVAERVLQLI